MTWRADDLALCPPCNDGSSMASDAPHLTFLGWADKGAAIALTAALALSSLPLIGNARYPAG